MKWYRNKLLKKIVHTSNRVVSIVLLLLVVSSTIYEVYSNYKESQSIKYVNFGGNKEKPKPSSEYI